MESTLAMLALSNQQFGDATETQISIQDPGAVTVTYSARRAEILLILMCREADTILYESASCHV
jgi:hypothetical protein